MAIDRPKVTKQAESFLASGKYDRAFDEFQKLLDDRPDDSNMLNRVGDLCLQANRKTEAVEMFRKAAHGYEREGFLNKATAVLKKAHRSIPEDVDLAGRLAELYRQTNLIKDAIAIHIEIAEVLTKKGLIKRALEEFAKVVELDPKNLKNKVKLADLYNKEGLKERAAAIYLEVAESLAHEQTHGTAHQVLERAKSMVSTPQVFLTQSRLCIIQKDLTAAAAMLRQGLEANPRSPEILEALAEVELQAHCPDRALEVLSQMPQLPEKVLTLCERALRELARAGRTEQGLALFQPIGREIARRGSGDIAARVLQNALQGGMTAEAYLQLADIHHQSGRKDERGEALSRAYGLAHGQNNLALMAQLAPQMDSLGISTEQALAGVAAPGPKTTSGFFETTEVDPVKRMQVQQLERDAESFLRNRFNDKALEAYQKILDLDLTNRDAIHRVAEIIQAGGKMTQVQMHYVKLAEKLAPMGEKVLALELLDKAEALFPGSTRMYRRTLGLLDVQVAPAPAQGTMPSMPSSALPAPVTPAPAPAALPAYPEIPPHALPLIALDLPGEVSPQPTLALPLPIALPAPEPEVESFPLIPLVLEPLDLGKLEPQADSVPAPAEAPVPAWSAPTPAIPLHDLEFPPVLSPDIPEPAPQIPEPAPFTLESSPALPELPAAPLAEELQPSDFTAPQTFQMPGLEPLELEPLSFLQDLPTTPQPAPVAAEPMAAPAALDEELLAILPDIDFQLDYGSPEEAKLAIQEALFSWPNHPELIHRLDQAELALHKLGHEVKPAAIVESDFTGSFFDLTDVLGDALLATGEGEEMHDATRVVEKIQSVEELFNAFREGVEQQVRGDDYDTHYNLGIAYKEMMLIEPAMEEFKKAMVDPERTLECCSMLSICEMSQGNIDGAIEWLHRGIDAPGFPPEDSIGLRYDLGEALLLQGKVGEAKVEYRRVFELDPEYRDVANKV